MKMMNGGTPFEQRDIIIIPFPFTDLSANKQRPALIISNDEFNRRNLDVVCCMITSHFESSGDQVAIRDGDCEHGPMGKKSVVKPYRLFTVSKSRIIKRYNRLGIPRALTVVGELKKIINIEPGQKAAGPERKCRIPEPDNCFTAGDPISGKQPTTGSPKP